VHQVGNEYIAEIMTHGQINIKLYFL